MNLQAGSIPARSFSPELEVKLDAAQDNVFRACGCRAGGGTAVVEGGGFVIKLQLDVTVEVPIGPDTPGSLIVGGSCAGKERK